MADTDTDTVTIPADIAKAFTDTWHGAVTEEVASALRCEEVDALGDLLNALGASDAAAEWFHAHAKADDPGDNHHQDPADPPDAATGDR